MTFFLGQLEVDCRVVERGENLVTFGREHLGEMRSDHSSGAGNPNPHEAFPTTSALLTGDRSAP